MIEEVREKYPNLKREDIIAAAQLMASVDEIAFQLQVPKHVLEDYFLDAINEGWATAKLLLRQKQFKLAQDGDVEMLKWLGRQYLGQGFNDK